MTNTFAERLGQMNDDDLRAEVERQREAKRQALAVADQLAKELTAHRDREATRGSWAKKGKGRD